MIGEDKPCFTSFDQADGLTSKRVISLLEDRQGRLWCGTRGQGVSFYEEDENGQYQFKNMPTTDTLPDLEIRAMLEAQDGGL
jgi:ligand-binding sensor domain-containing protein